MSGFLPEKLEWNQAQWNQAQWVGLNMVEEDPYTKPNRIFDAIVEKKHSHADYDALSTISMTGNVFVG